MDAHTVWITCGYVRLSCGGKVPWLFVPASKTGEIVGHFLCSGHRVRAEPVDGDGG